jgi:excinuclease UvrABC nuclease subunit
VSGGRVLVHVDTGSNFPAFRVTHRPGRKGVTVGPFTSRAAVDRTIEQLREVYGLRKCSRRMNEATAERPCAYRDLGTCPAPCSGAIASEEYRERVEQALSVLDRPSNRYRSTLVSLLADSERASRADDVIRYREAIRAYERVSSSLRTIRGAHATKGPIIVEVGVARVALHFLLGGYVAKTLRSSRDEALSPAFHSQIERAVRGWYFEERAERDVLTLPTGRLREIFMVANHRTRERPAEVAVGDSPAATARAVGSALRRIMKSPRRSHSMA